MDEEKNDKVQEEMTDEISEDIREEEMTDETSEDSQDRDNVYVNDDEIEMLRSIEKKFGVLEEKIDNMISMYVDSGAIVQDSIDDISEQERDSYEDDFINIDEMDLSL